MTDSNEQTAEQEPTGAPTLSEVSPHLIAAQAAEQAELSADQNRYLLNRVVVLRSTIEQLSEVIRDLHEENAKLGDKLVKTEKRAAARRPATRKSAASKSS